MRANAVIGRITLTAVPILFAMGCVVGPDEPIEEKPGTTFNHQPDPSIERGRDIWFNNTYGGEKFFTFLANHPDPAKRITIGFEAVASTPRADRFEQWGTINDPDCVANPAGGHDICDDPNSAGVVGIRKFPGPGGTTMFGVACAACHAGFDPLNPPSDPAEPEWDNIHATIGNQYAKFGDIFAANLAHDDVRSLLFASWPSGAVDTTLLFSDNIMNPGTVTAFWEHKNRNTFDVGMNEPKLRNGQGGEDDVGGDVAALRVYTNIGVCFQECTLPAMLTDQPISIDACRATCSEFPPQQDLDDMSNFLASFDRPKYPAPPTALFMYYFGKSVFETNCASCHANDGDLRRVLSNDEVNSLAAMGENATNACRSLTTNWEEGRLWAEFSSDVYKQRVEDGLRGYRTMPLGGIWTTAPFMHNQSIGKLAPADAQPWERAAYYWDSMFELLSRDREPIVHTTPIDLPGIPKGTPLHYVFSRDPATGQVLCNDLQENRGHYYGADLPIWQKIPLIYWLQYQ